MALEFALVGGTTEPLFFEFDGNVIHVKEDVDPLVWLPELELGRVPEPGDPLEELLEFCPFDVLVLLLPLLALLELEL